MVTTADGASAPYTVTVLEPFAVVAASATGTTEVVVTFTRDVAAASVLPARFTIAGLTVSAATTAGNTVTLTTSAQTADEAYTVSVDSALLDTLGTPVLASDTAFAQNQSTPTRNAHQLDASGTVGSPRW